MAEKIEQCNDCGGIKREGVCSQCDYSVSGDDVVRPYFDSTMEFLVDTGIDPD